jgi:hypothetical protein
LLAARKRRNDPAIYRDKADPRIFVGLAVFAACMLAWVLWAIWIATTKGVTASYVGNFNADASGACRK